MADEIRKLQEDRASGRIALTAKGGGFDSDIYGEEDRSAYNQFLPPNDLMEDDDEDAGGGGGGSTHPSSRSRINPSRALIDASLGAESELSEHAYREQYGTGLVNTRISDRESEVRMKANAVAYPPTQYKNSKTHSFF